MTYYIEILESELKLMKDEAPFGLRYFRKDGNYLTPAEYHIPLSGEFFEELIRLSDVCEGYVIIEWEDGDRTKYVLRDGQLEAHEAVVRYEKLYEIRVQPVKELLEKGAVKIKGGALVHLREQEKVCYVSENARLVCITDSTSTHAWKRIADILGGRQTPVVLCRHPFGAEIYEPLRKKAIETARRVF
jgi:hypothetical protein